MQFEAWYSFRKIASFPDENVPRALIQAYHGQHMLRLDPYLNRFNRAVFTSANIWVKYSKSATVVAGATK